MFGSDLFVVPDDYPSGPLGFQVMEIFRSSHLTEMVISRFLIRCG